MIQIDFQPSPDEVRRDLAALHEELQEKVIYRAVVAAGGAYKTSMRSTAPAETGSLRAAIGHRKLSVRDKAALSMSREQSGVLVGPVRRVPVKTLTYNVAIEGGGSVSVTVKRTVRRSRVAQILEEGSEPHVIHPKDKSGSLAIRGGHFVKKVHHPGIRPTKFMERAWAMVGERPNDLFYRALSLHLNRVKAKSAA